ATEYGCQQHSQRSERLERLVVKLTGPSAPLVIGRRDCRAQSVRLDAAMDSYGGCHRSRKRAQRLLVVGGKGRSAGAVVKGGEYRDARVPVDHRYKQRGAGVRHAELIDTQQESRHVRYSLGAPTL